jgi:hypothetical protein
MIFNSILLVSIDLLLGSMGRCGRIGESGPVFGQTCASHPLVGRLEKLNAKQIFDHKLFAC